MKIMKGLSRSIFLLILLCTIVITGVQAATYLGSYSSYNVLLMHMNGTQGGTVFIDDTGKTTYPVSVTTDQNVKRFGNASALFSGTGSNITLLDSEAWNLSGQFTIHTLQNWSTVADGDIVGQADGARYWVLMYYSGALTFRVHDSINAENWATYTWTPSANTPYNIDVVNNATYTQLFVNGAPVGTSITHTYLIENLSSPLYIGRGSYSGSSAVGHMDEVAIWKNVAIPIGDLYPQLYEIETPIPIAPNPSFSSQNISIATNTTSEGWGGYAPFTMQFNDTSTENPTNWNWSIYSLNSSLSQYDAYNVLLMHMDGVNGGTIFTEENGKVTSSTGTAQTNTTTKVLGNASGHATGVTGHVTLADSPDWNYGSGNFTIHVHARSDSSIYSYTIMAQSDSSLTASSRQMQITGNDATWPNRYYISIWNSSGARTDTPGTQVIAYNEFSTLDVIREGNSLNFYVNGTLDISVNVTGVTLQDATGKLGIFSMGDYDTDHAERDMYVDEVAIWKGVAIPIGELYPRTKEIYPPSISGYTITNTTQNMTYAFSQGNWSVHLTAGNQYGSNTSNQITWVNVSAQPNNILADFTISNTTGIVPLLTHFTDTSTTNQATIDSWNWSFGDGNISSTQSPDHTYVNNGTYIANLTISNISYSLTSTKLSTVTVFNQPPVANFTASNLSGTPPLLVQFTDTSTGQNISVWNWSFGDGNISSLQNPSYTYNYIGEYQVNLTITNDGGSSTKLQNITVAMFGAHFIANQSTGSIPFAVQFTDTSIGNYDTWNWSVDDGTLHWYNKTTYADRNLIYTFNNVGSWRVNLSVQNISESGPIYSTSMNVTATNVPPIASYTYYPSAGTTSTTFIFNDTSTGVITTRNWSFGDGNYSVVQNVTHTFPSNGIYNVNLTVSNDGGSSFVVHTVTISSFAVTTYISPTSGVIPLLVTFNETYSGLIPDSYYWEFGDGATSTNKNTTHTYTTIGTFNVSHRVINDSTVLWSNTTGAVTTLAGSVAANFTANVTAGNYPLNVQFTDTSTYINATPSSWLWVFGDGFTSALQNPSHTYSNAGSYSVNFTTNTNQGSSYLLKSNYINVGGVAANGRQDVILMGSHNITLYVKDASSGNLISSSTVFDELGHELTSYRNGVFTGYYSTGQHTFTANATNYYTNRATYLVSSNLIQTIYLTQVATSVSTTWYTPKTIQISFTDVYGNQLAGASVNARYNETTLPNGVSDLISNYGMNANVANEALNGTLLMAGTTDSSGEIVFTMLSTIKYDVVVTYGGQTNYYSIYPQNPQYQFKFITPVTADNIWNDLYANGNTKVWATEPDPANVTFWWSFQDMTNLTTGIDYFLNDVDLNTIVYTAHVSSPTAGSIYQLNYTVPNIRGKNYIAYVNYTRNA